MNKHIKPTESELEILGILWERGASTVREVHEILEQSKEAGYTTTLKLMQIMHEKGILSRDASAKTHIYEASISRESTQQQLLNKMIDTVYNGSATKLVMQALGHHRSSQEELDQIRQYLNEMEKKQK